MGLFVGRGHDLGRLEKVGSEAGRAVVVAVHGLGGIGKSTLAAHFARTQKDRFSLVWWQVQTVVACDLGVRWGRILCRAGDVDVG